MIQNEVQITEINVNSKSKINRHLYIVKTTVGHRCNAQFNTGNNFVTFIRTQF